MSSLALPFLLPRHKLYYEPLCVLKSLGEKNWPSFRDHSQSLLVPPIICLFLPFPDTNPNCGES